jgi:glutathione S-transferase
LRLRNFLVGHQLTLADAVLVSTLSTCFELVFDKKVRKSNIPNTSRYTTLLLKTPPFVSSFGTVAFCQNAIMPQFTDSKGGK